MQTTMHGNVRQASVTDVVANLDHLVAYSERNCRVFAVRHRLSPPMAVDLYVPGSHRLLLGP